MEIFRILVSVGFLIIIGCSQSINRTTSYYENEYFIIDKKPQNIKYNELLGNKIISENADSLFKGEKISPLGNSYNDDSGIYLKLKPNKSQLIFLFNLNTFESEPIFKGEILLKPVKINKEIKIKRKELEKLFDPGLYRLVIVENNLPVLNFKMWLLY